jgi:hypothetical protein
MDNMWLVLRAVIIYAPSDPREPATMQQVDAQGCPFQVVYK